MALSSMTGFARAHGASGAYAWTWELKSVNAKGLDLRLRLPPGWDAVEPPARARAAEALSRGTIYATLTANRAGVAPVEAAPPSLDGILGLKGVIEVADADESEDERRAAEAAIVAGFGQALADLVDMRRHEGKALGHLLATRLKEIAALAAR